MDSMKPVALMAVIFVVIIALVITYSDSQMSKKDDQLHRKDVTICQLQNQLNNTNKKCV